jgi:hypothetical protein
MTVERTHAGHQTRYEIRDSAGFVCALTYTADPDEPATWKILLPGPGRTEDLYGTQRFADPGPARIRAWLSPLIGSDRAAELAAAVDAAPPTARSPRPCARTSSRPGWPRSSPPWRAAGGQRRGGNAWPGV